MTQYSKAAFLSKWNTRFADNSTREIDEGDIREFKEDIKDSFLNLTDQEYSGIKGLASGLTSLNDLRAIPTTALSTGVCVVFRDGGNGNILRVYELVASAASESAPFIIRPDDFAVTTNEKVWDIARLNRLTAWDMSTNAFPVSGLDGQEYYGTELSTRTTLTDSAGNLLPSKVIAKALQDYPTTSDHFAFINVIF